MKDLTEKQEQILKYITKIKKEKSYSPTVREIGDEFHITPKGAYDHLKALERKGFIRMSKNQSRAIELLKPTSEGFLTTTTGVPLLGRVAAGLPIFAEENIEDYIPIPEHLSKEGPVYALRVVGDSMIDAGIFDGDIAIILKKETARNGEIVVALLEGEEATLKYFYKEKDTIKLQPANKRYKPILAAQVQILGKLIGIIRYY